MASPILFYSSTAVQTTLAADLAPVASGSTGQRVEVTAVDGFPSQYPFTLLLEWGSASQEVVTLTQAPTGSGPFIFDNCIRGDDNSNAPAHSSGATVNHGVSARDFNSHPVVVSTLAFGADPTGANPSGAKINNAISAAPSGSTVYSPYGKYVLETPIVLQKPVNFIGDRGCTPSGDDAGARLGTVFQVSSSFSNPWSAYATAAVLCLDQTPGTGGAIQGIRLEKFWVDGSIGASGVDGTALVGPVNSVYYTHVGVWKATGNGFALYNDAGTEPDGTHYRSCLAQTCGKHGWFGQFTDASFDDCHAQTCGTSGTGSGFFITGGNNQLSICRSDLNGEHGYVIDHPGGDGYDDYNLFVGCTTQRNAKNGVLITNSSATGTQYRMPVKFSGCAFTGDGTAGPTYAGVWVEGTNVAEFSGCSIRAYTFDVGASACPTIGIQTATIGTGPGSPTSITWTGGSINVGSGGSLVNDSAGVQGSLIISDTTVGSIGYDSGTIIRRVGSATLSAGTVTVSNAWVTSSSRIFVSPNPGGTPPAGFPYISARGSGTFTIKSTSNTDAYSVFWRLSSQ